MEKMPTPENTLPKLMERILLLKSLIHDDGYVDVIVEFAKQTAEFDKELDEALLAHNHSPTDKEAVPEWRRLMGQTTDELDGQNISAESRAIIMGGIQRFVDRFVRESGLDSVILEQANDLIDSEERS